MTPCSLHTRNLPPEGWHASLDLSLRPGPGKTLLGKTVRFGPLTVQQPFYPEGDVCNLYLLHPPGGLVGGDRLELTVRLEKGSHGFITTPGATKFYRSSGRSATQEQIFHLDSGSVLEWFPQETILFDHAVAGIDTIVNLAPDAIFMGWEILCLGLPAVKQRFESGKLISKMCIRQNAIPVFMDRLQINHAKDLDAPAGLKGFPVCASFWATGVNEALFVKVRDTVLPGSHILFGMTQINDILVARCLANNPQDVRDVFTQIRQNIRPKLTGKSACTPRIWNT